MNIFLIGLALLCTTSITDALGDSKWANHNSPFWKWFYGVEEVLFKTAFGIMAVGVLSHLIGVLVAFLH